MDSAVPLWSAACESLRKTLHRDVFARWIEPIAAKGVEQGVLVLAVDNDWSRFFIEQNYADFIRAALREADPTASFRIDVDESLVPAAQPAPEPPAPKKAPPPRAAAKQEDMGMPLDATFCLPNTPADAFTLRTSVQHARLKLFVTRRNAASKSRPKSPRNI